MVFSRTTFILEPNCKRNWIYQCTTVQQDQELLKAPSNSRKYSYMTGQKFFPQEVIGTDFMHPCFHWRGTICFVLKHDGSRRTFSLQSQSLLLNVIHGGFLQRVKMIETILRFIQFSVFTRTFAFLPLGHFSCNA